MHYAELKNRFLLYSMLEGDLVKFKLDLPWTVTPALAGAKPGNGI